MFRPLLSNEVDILLRRFTESDEYRNMLAKPRCYLFTTKYSSACHVKIITVLKTDSLILV